MKRFIVASASPRRRELLQNAGFSFDVIPSDADESINEALSPEETVMLLAKRKAVNIFEKNTDAVVLGCDTVVELDGIILGKPENAENAKEMLLSLSGKTHNVHTGVCLKSSEKEKTFVSTTKVEFYDNSEDIIDRYIATGDPMDKAGAYGIQTIGSVLVKGIEGDYFTVVGLPVAKTVRELESFGVVGTLI